MLRVIQANLQHSRAASAALCQSMTAHNIELALIQEPWLHKGRIAGLADAKGKLIYNNTIQNTRTCILVRNGVQVLPLLEYCSRDMTCVKLRLGTGERYRDLILCSAYLPYDAQDPPPPREVEALVEATTLSGQHLLIGCDANAHNEVWGSTDTNRRGESLLQFIVTKDLYTVNVGNKPTFRNRIRSEVIDLTICTRSLCNLVSNWRVSDDPSLSDHCHIRFDINAHVAGLSSTYRNPRQADWHSYSEELSAMTGALWGGGRLRIHTVPELEQAATQLTDAMLESFRDNCPIKTKPSHSQVRWWSKSLESMKRRVRRLFNRSKNTGSREEYHRALTEYNLSIRRAKRLSWKAFCQNVSSTGQAARLQRFMACDPLNPVGTLKDSTGNFTSSPRETLNLLLDCHFPGGSHSDIAGGGLVITEHSPVARATREDWTLARSVVTVSKLKWAIHKFSPFKSPGGDGIFPAMLQKGPATLYAQLCEIFRASLAFGHVPQTWRVNKVVFIPKSGRGNYSDAKAYRPISLSSFFVKTLERLIEHHIRKGVLNDTPLHRNQHAYQPGKSCDSALHQLVSRVEDSLERKEIALGVFLDIEGAFNNTSYQSMIRALRERGVEPMVCGWVSHMLHSRRIQSTLLNEVVEIAASRGCPQGGVLSPLLWNLVVDSLLTSLSDRGLYTQGYADDIALLVFGKFANTISDIMNDGLKLISNWCMRENLTINPSKTVAIPFTRKNIRGSFGNLKLNGVTLEVSTSVKYLGITLDQKLTWNNHLGNVIRKAKWSFMTTRRCVGTNWGLQPQISLWLYTAVIRPQITYGAVVWWPKTKQLTAQNKLTSLQRLACMCTTGAFRSTPTAALEILLGLLPLDLFIFGEARLAAYRLQGAGNWRGSILGVGHSGIVDTSSENPVLSMNPDHMATKHLFHRPYAVTLDLRKEEDNYMPSREPIEWYTDGSKMGTRTGYGVYSSNPKTMISESLGTYSTIFQAEVFAILHCAQNAIEKGISGRRILILSDSQAALRALDSRSVTSRLVWECAETLCRLASRNNVFLKWVPGHTGIEGNERADKLAKEGASKTFLGPEPACGIGRLSAIHAVKTSIREKHFDRWKQFPGQKLGKSLVKSSSVGLTRSLLHLKKGQLRQVVSLITGHGHFRKHLSTVGLYHADPSCRLCGEAPESAEHIVLECEALGVRRRALFEISPPGRIVKPDLVRKLLNLVKGTVFLQ